MPQPVSEEYLNELIDQLKIDDDASSPDAASPMPDGPSTDDSANGMIVIQNNQIFITSPLSGGKPAVITAIAPVTLKIDQQPVLEPAAVTSVSRLSWAIEEPPQYSISVSEDKLQAFFTLHHKDRFAWRLVDCPAGSHVSVQAEQDSGSLISTLTLEQVIADFEKTSISHTLNIPALYAELSSPTHQPVCIAMGKAPVPGADARLELFFAETVENAFCEIEGSVDYRNHLRIPSAQRGDVIARKHPPEAGLPGYDVFGGILPAAPPTDIKVVAKDHTLLLPSNEITALREGRPRITGNHVKYFDISTAYVIPGNVNIKTGNIVFSGDIIVHNDVEDNMILESLGNIYIYGNVYNSTITATGSILVRGNVVNSQLYSGYFGVLYNRLYTISKLLLEDSRLLREAARVLTETLESQRRTVKYGQVILLLLESKFNMIPGLIHDLLNVLSNIRNTYHQDTDQLKQLLEVFLRPTQHIDFFQDSVLSAFLKLLKDLYSGVARMQEVKVQIDIPQCNNSTLKSNGDIYIHKEGILQSSLFSSGDISFAGEDAVCRGSSLEAAGTITAQTVGGKSSAPSALKAGEQISVRRMYEGRVTVGRYSEEIIVPVENTVFTVQSMRRV
ncbi:DUF342 domain-containing protein [Paenibacillus donghaensis]|nr:FapA family protein [Paenibacillus donghaensis]